MHTEGYNFLMFGRDAYTPWLQLLNPKLRNVSSGRDLLVLDAFRDIYVLVIHNIKLSKERQEDKLLIYHVSKYYVGDKALVKNHPREVWEPKYDAAYHVVWVMGRQLELIDKSGKTQKANVQDSNIMYLATFFFVYIFFFFTKLSGCLFV